MKINFKRSMAILALALAVLAPVSPAFCIGERSKLGSYHALIVGKYFENKKDLESLIMAGKKFEELGATYKFNPTPYDPVLYPNIQTYVAYPGEKISLNSFTNEIKTLVYSAGSFDLARYSEILKENDVNDQWGKTQTVDENTHKCSLAFEKGDKKIIFYFDLFKSTILDETMRETNFQIDRLLFNYNIFMKTCGLEYFVNTSTFKSNFKKIDIPKTVTKLQFGCFRGCRNLKNVNIPDTVATIGPAAFSLCREVEEINIPGSVKAIGDFAFNSCLSLKNITIPDSVVEIGSGAFLNCTSLRSIKIPNSVERIGYNIFDGDTLNYIEYKNHVYSSVDEFWEGLRSQNANN